MEALWNWLKSWVTVDENNGQQSGRQEESAPKQVKKDAKPGEYLAAQQSTLGSGHGLRSSPPSPSLAFLFGFIDVFFPAEQAAVLAWRSFLMSHNRVKVTLDPHMAHPLLFLAEDQRNVSWESKWQRFPSTEERFDIWCCVLGREEFREGRHCWRVVRGEKRGRYCSWAVGVARASLKRKGEITMSPEEGIWAVQYCEGHLMSLTLPRTRLRLSPVPTKVWVCLDCTQQQVSFINANNGVEIFTFTAASFNGESIRPWFWLGMNAQLFLMDNIV
nr:butyrophilin subfamily 1 member A1 isoform X2 [Anas platyrhynchos]